MSIAVDRWVCHQCSWMYEGWCDPHEPFGENVEEVGAHLWDEHRSVQPSCLEGRWTHHDAPMLHQEHLRAMARVIERLPVPPPPAQVGRSEPIGRQPLSGSGAEGAPS